MTKRFKRLFQKKKPEFSLGICIPVWNRGDLFLIAFKSLIKQLDGINATIWIFDNGSDNMTRDIIYNLEDFFYFVKFYKYVETADPNSAI